MATKRGTVGDLLVQMRMELGQLRTDVKEVEKLFTGTFAGIQKQASAFGKGLVGGLIGGLSVGAVVQFTRSIVDLGGKLTDLSEQTGISAQLLSGMKSTLEESGSSVEAFATGIFKAQKEIGEIKKESDPAMAAIHELGLNFEELRNASPEKFLKLVTDALAKQENVGRRNTLAFALLGRQARELVPPLVAMAGRLDDLKNAGIKEEDIRKLDEFGDAWTRFGNTLKIIAAGPLVDLIEGIERFFNLSERGRLTNSLVAIEDQLKTLDDQLKVIEERKGKGLTAGISAPDVEAAQLAKKQQLLEQQRQIDQKLNALNAGNKKTGGGDSKAPALIPDKTAQNALESFVAGLQKQADQIRVNIREMTLGGEAAKDYALELEFAAFKTKLLSDPKTAGAVGAAEKAFNAAREELRDLGNQANITKLTIEQVGENLTSADAQAGQAARDAAEQQGQLFRAVQENIRAFEQLQIARQIALAPDENDLGFKRIADEMVEFRDRLNEVRTESGKSKQEISTLGKIFGTSFDEAGENIARLDAEIRGLVSGGMSELDNEVIRLREELQTLRNFKELESAFLGVTSSITEGIKGTVDGILQGTQTLEMGLSNLVRNILVSVSESITEQFLIKPIQNIVNGFLSGLAEAFADSGDDTMKKIAQDLGRSLGDWLKQVLGSGGPTQLAGPTGGGGGILSGILGGVGGWIMGLFGGAERGGLIRPGLAFAGLPQFAAGGPVPIMAHGGEFVMRKRAVDSIGMNNLSRMNQSGKAFGGGGNTMTEVHVHGSIKKNDPEMTDDRVIQIVTRNLDDRGQIMHTFEQRTMIKGG